MSNAERGKCFIVTLYVPLYLLLYRPVPKFAYKQHEALWNEGCSDHLFLS